jgi:hypothetical protein
MVARFSTSSTTSARDGPVSSASSTRTPATGATKRAKSGGAPPYSMTTPADAVAPRKQHPASERPALRRPLSRCRWFVADGEPEEVARHNSAAPWHSAHRSPPTTGSLQGSSLRTSYWSVIG